MNIEELKAKLSPILEDYISARYPGHHVGAFVLNIFAADGSGDIHQETIGDGNAHELTPQEAYACVLESMTAHVQTWQDARPESAGQA